MSPVQWHQFQPRCNFNATDIRGCGIDFHSIPTATSWWWEHYWTRWRIEPRHIKCTLTVFFRVTFTKVEFSAAVACERLFNRNRKKRQGPQLDPFQVVFTDCTNSADFHNELHPSKTTTLELFNSRKRPTTFDDFWYLRTQLSLWRQHKRTS